LKPDKEDVALREALEHKADKEDVARLGKRWNEKPIRKMSRKSAKPS